MVSTDAAMVDQCCAWMHFGYSALIQLIVAIALLVRALGPPALVGVGVMILFIPFQTHIVKGLRFARRHALKFTDQRIKLLNEILVGIRVIKVYACTCCPPAPRRFEQRRLRRQQQQQSRIELD
jgi:hypothetical protein